MKKILLSSLFFLIAFVANAQGIYTKVKKYDKFDDVVWEKDVKTIINKGLSKITIETKGTKPVEYIYYDTISLHDGRRDSLSNLIGDVYGYEEWYSIFPKTLWDKARDEALEECKELPDTLITESIIESFVKKTLLSKIVDAPTIVFRTISKYKYVFEYDTDLVWIRFRDGSRIIYSKR